MFSLKKTDYMIPVTLFVYCLQRKEDGEESPFGSKKHKDGLVRV